MPTTQIEVTELETPVGAIRVAAHDGRLCGLTFEDGWRDLEARLQRRFGEAEFSDVDEASGVSDHVQAYLDGEIPALQQIQVEPDGTEFQLRVWSALRAVPAGETASYREIATAIGQPGAVRAVGSANGANQIAIVIPCHRVIRSDGTIGGYGGGLDRKRWLLAHEREHVAR